MMANIDNNVIIIALPTIGKDLPGTSALDLVWIVIGYQLVVAATLVNFGRLGDIFGRVRLYKLGFLGFTVSSALCSLAQTGAQLVALRFLQGLGASILSANTMAIITDAFPREERGKALGTNQISIAAGSTFGLVLGGLLTGTIGWRSIFWINVPVGVFAVVWSHFQLKELGELDKSAKIDIPGNITFLAGLGVILASITLYALALLSAAVFTALLGASIAVLFFFVLFERRAQHPMLKLGLLRIPAVAVGNLANFVVILARGTVLLVLTFFLQGPSMELTPLIAGVFLLPNAVSASVSGPLSGWLSDKYGPRIFTMTGTACQAVGAYLLAQLGTTVTYGQLALPIVLIGAGTGLFASPNRASVMNAIRAGDRGVVSGLYSTFLNTGSVLSRGLAFLVMGLTLPAVDLQAVFAGKVAQATPDWVSRFITSLHAVFYVTTAIFGAAVFISLLRLSGAIGAGPEVSDDLPVAPRELPGVSVLYHAESD